MPGYRNNSPWNDANEIACLIIFKQLQDNGFPRGMQMALCRDLAQKTELKIGSISAKVCNYKSIAGINNSSHNSIQSEHFYTKYGHMNVVQLQKVYHEAQFQ